MYKFPFPRSQVKIHAPLSVAILKQTDIPLLENNEKSILNIHFIYLFLFFWGGVYREM